MAALRDISRAIATDKYPRHLNVKKLQKPFILIGYSINYSLFASPTTEYNRFIKNCVTNDLKFH
jgi:hypothetical protein